MSFDFLENENYIYFRTERVYAYAMQARPHSKIFNTTTLVMNLDRSDL